MGRRRVSRNTQKVVAHYQPLLNALPSPSDCLLPCPTVHCISISVTTPQASLLFITSITENPLVRHRRPMPPVPHHIFLPPSLRFEHHVEERRDVRKTFEGVAVMIELS